ncbi:MAG: hypothetical protein COY75_09200, partial [Nitrospirae bacterium CG_4_10_14_0_8_um_filter_41_23]
IAGRRQTPEGGSCITDHENSQGVKGTRDKKVTVYHVRQKGGVNVKEKQLTPLLNLLFYRNWCEN